MHWRIMKVLNDFKIARQQLFQLRAIKLPLFANLKQ